MSKDWNAAYLNEDTPWDKGEAAPPLREFLSREAVSGRVLVPGCGAGHDVRLFAAQGAQVLGVDVAPAAVELAESLPRVAREVYWAGDFLQLPEELVGQFDWVVEHTCLCALDVELREAYAASVARALKEGGHYLAVFYREIPNYDGDGPPHPISADEIDALFCEGFEVVERFVPELSYASRPHGAEELCWMRKRCT